MHPNEYVGIGSVEGELSFSSRQAVKDYRLFLFVGALLALDTLLLTTWQIVDPLKMFKKISQKEVGQSIDGELPDAFVLVFDCIHPDQGRRRRDSLDL